MVLALPDKQCLSDPLPTWLLKKSINVLGPERGLFLTQKADIPVALGAVGGSGSRAGVREKTSVTSSFLSDSRSARFAVRHSSWNHSEDARTR